ncbi:hypothetical protein BOTBODRAFT_171564 [Botryobasidium botryosum FD-172 SS1]|uniref:Uncharacterized protein n=1 Tax=Botryobasidium botryosum (strain FD-172 SS1) TaxID=930990 RepID=A0A067MT43_BOTB1|nr:hypothetical protein BOTBODRAFT_171564 [Botryobasidium botryosum FD-172 SS1]
MIFTSAFNSACAILLSAVGRMLPAGFSPKFIAQRTQSPPTLDETTSLLDETRHSEHDSARSSLLGKVLKLALIAYASCIFILPAFIRLCQTLSSRFAPSDTTESVAGEDVVDTRHFFTRMCHHLWKKLITSHIGLDSNSARLSDIETQRSNVASSNISNVKHTEGDKVIVSLVEGITTLSSRTCLSTDAIESISVACAQSKAEHGTHARCSVEANMIVTQGQSLIAEANNKTIKALRAPVPKGMPRHAMPRRKRPATLEQRLAKIPAIKIYNAIHADSLELITEDSPANAAMIAWIESVQANSPRMVIEMLETAPGRDGFYKELYDADVAELAERVARKKRRAEYGYMKLHSAQLQVV